MNLLIFFLINFASFGTFLVLYGYGFEKESYKLMKYLIAFFSGMLAMELIM